MMKYRLVNRTFSILACLIALADLAVAQQAKEPTTGEERRASFQKAFENLGPAHLYGIVLDQSGQGVARAEVKIGWANATGLAGKPDPGQTSWVTTEADGIWQFTVPKPWRAFVTEVRKEGYIYDRQQNPAKDLIENRTTPETPFVSRVRKLGETAFLLRKDGELLRVLSPGQKTVPLDVVKDRSEERKSGSTYADVWVSVEYRPDDAGWTVTCRSTNATDGIIASENLMHEAPAEGYKAEVTLPHPPWPRYLYLRTRTPPVYCRLDVEYDTWNESETVTGFKVRYVAWVNPYGSRNLEYAPELVEQWQLRKQLEREAKADLLQNKRPVKPDLPKLVKEAKEKAGKDKDKP